MAAAAPAAPPATRAIAEVMCHHDEAGLCHIVGEYGGTLCGRPVASDSPGIHSAPDIRADTCGGCQRPRCPECRDLAG
jgi:hypothetical protein